MNAVDNLLDHVRSACQEVTSRARYVHIDRSRIPAYAASLPLDELLLIRVDPRDAYSGSEEDLVAFVLTLDAVNFGSGYLPNLKTASDASVYFMIATALKARFEGRGPFTPQELSTLEPRHCSEIFQQDCNNEGCRELMAHFTKALNDLGDLILTRFDGKFRNLVIQANSSVEELVKILIEMPYFRDVAQYQQMAIPFYKRAQITAADLFLRFEGRGPGRFRDLERLTVFADNKVPHVLRLDGILSYEDSLASRIAVGAPIPAGSDEEIEIRASAVHAVDLLIEELRRTGHDTLSMYIDFYLWNRGQAPRYKLMPRHLTRTVFY
jgi:hypothetical protein